MSRIASALFLFIGTLLSCAGPPQKLTRSQLMMGDIEVRITVLVPAGKNDWAFEQIGKAFDEARRLEGIFSEFQPESEASRLNRSAGAGPTRLGPEMMALLQSAGEVTKRTGGLFDVTYPSGPSVNWSQVVFDEGNGTVSLPAGAVLGLSGIAKGAIVDRIADGLRQSGIRSGLVQAGGDLKSWGKDLQGPWEVGLTDPRRPGGPPLCRLTLGEAALASSGNYERGNHIVDPQTGQPPQSLAGVSVIATNATLADGLATDGFLLGPSSLSFASRRTPDVLGVVTVTRDGQILVNTSLKNDCH